MVGNCRQGRTEKQGLQGCVAVAIQGRPDPLLELTQAADVPEKRVVELFEVLAESGTKFHQPFVGRVAAQCLFVR